RLYRSGALVQTFALQSGGLNTDGDFFIGGSPLYDALFNGALDEVALYDRSLTSEEILSVVDAGPSGRRVILDNQPPFVLAGFDRSLVDVFSFELDGFVSDDGLPIGGELT